MATPSRTGLKPVGRADRAFHRGNRIAPEQPAYLPGALQSSHRCSRLRDSPTREWAPRHARRQCDLTLIRGIAWAPVNQARLHPRLPSCRALREQSPGQESPQALPGNREGCGPYAFGGCRFKRFVSGFVNDNRYADFGGCNLGRSSRNFGGRWVHRPDAPAGGRLFYREGKADPGISLHRVPQFKNSIQI